MTPNKGQFRRQDVLLLYVMGIAALSVALLSPHPGHLDGRSFFEVARSSPWDRWWDWSAAWCSVKIVLLSLGVASVLAALGMLAKQLRQQILANVVLFFSAVATLGCAVGFCCLLKALL